MTRTKLVGWQLTHFEALNPQAKRFDFKLILGDPGIWPCSLSTFGVFENSLVPFSLFSIRTYFVLTRSALKVSRTLGTG